MSCKTLIVNELLAFIHNAIDTMDEVSIMQICKTNFKEEEISSGKVLLYQTLDKIATMPSRRRNGGEKCIQDIISLLKVTDPDDVPDFVAKELHKLPPVGFDHVDVTRLLKDITFLKASLAEVHTKLEASEKTISDLRVELASYRDAHAICRSPVPSYVNARRGDQNACVGILTADVDVSPTADDPSDAPRPTPVTSPPEKTSHVTLPAAPQCDYAAAASKMTATPKSSKGVNAPVRKSLPSKTKDVDEDGFTKVQKKKKLNRQNKCGTATKDPNLRMRAEVPTTPLYVSRVHYCTKTEDVVEYLHAKTGLSLRVERLESRHKVSFNSFVVRVPTAKLSVYMDEGFWPQGVVFRRFRGRIPGPPESRHTPKA
ncbi:uncharacterized protein LOC123692696 [Colias croceus]|uniref:uncharacterized protein LOC123692696 n=1 Tax=Colias crocea TaxID=72248 RepID=UPI001E27FD20|nr:uncharacterized protein LOC123692696 [Colias croceus]